MRCVPFSHLFTLISPQCFFFLGFLVECCKGHSTGTSTMEERIEMRNGRSKKDDRTHPRNGHSNHDWSCSIIARLNVVWLLVSFFFSIVPSTAERICWMFETEAGYRRAFGHYSCTGWLLFFCTLRKALIFKQARLRRNPSRRAAACIDVTSFFFFWHSVLFLFSWSAFARGTMVAGPKKTVPKQARFSAR